MMSVSNCHLCVRDVAVDGGPVLPAGWISQQEDGGWYTLRRESDGPHTVAWRANSYGALALWAMFGPLPSLEIIAPAGMPAREAWERRGEAAVRAWLRRWRHWRIDGHVRDAEGVAQPVTSAVVELVPEGAQIPDPTVTALPWLLRADGSVTAVQAESAVRVSAIYRPALSRTIAGYSLHQVCEDEPERTP